MAEHFTVDVDPETLRSAETRIADLAGQLEEEGGKLEPMPARATDWTGEHAGTLKTATTLVARDMRAASPRLQEAAAALRSFRRVADRVLEAMPGLNRRWEAIVSAYDGALLDADRAFDRSKEGVDPRVWRAEEDTFASLRGSRRTNALETRDREQRLLTEEYDGHVDDLERAARTCGAALAAAVVSPVSEATAAHYAATGRDPGLGAGEFSPADYLSGKQPFTRGVGGLLDDLVARGVLPPEVAGMSADQLDAYLLEHPEVARELVDNRPYGGDPGSAEAFLHAITLPSLSAPGTDVADRKRADVCRYFESLTGEEQRLLAMVLPSVVGDLPGVPFSTRADANRVKVIVTLADQTATLAELEEQHEQNQGDWDFLGLNNNDLDGPIADAKRRIALYGSILGDDRQVILFDPADDGRIAELSGTIDATTRNVGVLVPGTGASLGKFQGDVDRSESFVDESQRLGYDDLAMVTWIGGDLPDGVVKDAPFSHYATDLAPGLAGFSHELRQEVEHAGANDANLTFAGHSYGGSVVGSSERFGLDADRVLHIESAGMGPDVDDPDDLSPTRPGVRRYSMTAEQDFIGLTQGTGAGDDIGHGADPDTFEGTTRLDTGNFADGSLIDGTFASHSDVFTPRSDAWRNMLDVFRGGEVRLRRDPEYLTHEGGVTQLPYEEPAEVVDIP